MFRPTPSGLRRRQVQLLARDTGTRDALNQANTWIPYLTIRAYIQAIGGNEALHGGAQYVSEVTHRINIRCPRGTAVLAKHRVMYGFRVWEIKAVQNIDELNRELDLLCLEIDDGGATTQLSSGGDVTISTIAVTAPAAGAFEVAHGLNYTPRAAQIAMTSLGSIVFQAAKRFDATYLYLVASEAGLTADVDCIQ